MASKVMASTALFLSLNLLIFFALVTSHNVDNNYPLDNHSKGSSSTTNSKNPIPVVILPEAIYPNGNGNNPHYNQGQRQDEVQSGRCNPLNLGVCINLLGLVDVEIGNVPTKPCCSLILGLVDLEAAVCLCTAIRANVLGIIEIDLPISLSVLLNNCGMTPSAEYQCSP